MFIRFRINNELVELYPPSDDEDLINKLTDDNEYTNDYICQLAESRQISVENPIMMITRFRSKTEEEIVYNIQAQMRNESVEVKDSPELNIWNSENSDPNTSQSKQSDLWDDANTKFILDQFHNYLMHIGPMKRFKTKKVMWEQISADLKSQNGLVKSALQVENRYKTLIRRKKDAIVNNSKSGRSRKTVCYEEELSKIASLDDSIEPELIQSPKSVKIFKKLRTTESDSDQEIESNQSKSGKGIKERKQRKTSSIVNTLQKLHIEKEDAREKRHQEKLELIRELFGKHE